MSEVGATQIVGTNPVPDETGLCACIAASNLPQAHDGPSRVDHSALTAGCGNVADLDHSDRCTATLSIPERVGACVHCSSWDWIPPDDEFPPEDLYYPTDPDLPGGPPVITAQDHLDAELDELLGRNRLSRVDDLEWEEWNGIDQDGAEREMLRRDAPAWVSLPPGGDLATALEGTRPQAMSPIALIELMKATSRLSGWAEAIKTTAMASFYRQRQAEHAASPRPSQVDSNGRPIDPERSWHAEIALALGLSRDTVARSVATALRLTGPLRSTHTALKCGALTWGKALAISEATADLPDQATQAVEAHVLKRAAAQTHKNLLESLRRQVAKHRSAEEADEHRAAVAERTCKIVPLANGMAGLWIVHTADKIQQIWVTIHAMATLAKRHTPTTADTTAADAKPRPAAADPEPPTAPPPAPSGPGNPDHTTTRQGALNHAPTTGQHPRRHDRDGGRHVRSRKRTPAPLNSAALTWPPTCSSTSFARPGLARPQTPRSAPPPPTHRSLRPSVDPARPRRRPRRADRLRPHPGRAGPPHSHRRHLATTPHRPRQRLCPRSLDHPPRPRHAGDRDPPRPPPRLRLARLQPHVPRLRSRPHHPIRPNRHYQPHRARAVLRISPRHQRHPRVGLDQHQPSRRLHHPDHPHRAPPHHRPTHPRPHHATADRDPIAGQRLRRPGTGPTVEQSPHRVRRQSAVGGRTAASDPPPF